MGNFEHLFVLGLVIIALLDRFLIRRKSVQLNSIGMGVVKGGALAFPVSLSVRSCWVSDAQVEYWLKDLKNPTVVIAGKTRTVDTSIRGVREEYLLINSRYLEPARWDLRVRITNGNCRLNPFYRIFPMHEVMEKQYTITTDEGGRWNVQ
ncbi:lysis protein (plasmid) [Raoultella ornithinolytica]|uniref:lysis protein n=1 Tax=Raoultella ornithinolytica TaxID=54291 RepID=UPI00292C2412|nr:lysis protein [Raoultella ornithinolytica]MDV1094940.1 lysis protein [Raoultella ornithinolytica]MDV1122716.1 lysis protein [Raoultella ornithinolytica]MDV1893231.1 lysis protein [Raoultella ornithinolytica]